MNVEQRGSQRHELLLVVVLCFDVVAQALQSARDLLPTILERTIGLGGLTQAFYGLDEAVLQLFQGFVEVAKPLLVCQLSGHMSPWCLVCGTL